jgi:hypothetical protein
MNGVRNWPENAYLLAPNCILGRMSESFSDATAVSVLSSYGLLCRETLELLTGEMAGHGKFLLFGHIYNPFTGTIGVQALRDLAHISPDDGPRFFDAFDSFSGRFVLFIERSDGRLTILPDAAASLPVAYAQDGEALFASSHPNLLGRLLGLLPDSEMAALARTRVYRLGIRHCPADRTEVSGVRYLTPNLMLEHERGRLSIRRLFPRQARQSRATAEVVEEIGNALSSSVACLRRLKLPMTCALSGGVDSRMTLAATRGQRDGVRFFTYAGSGNEGRDLAATRRLSERLGFDLQVVNLSPANGTDGTLDRCYESLTSVTRMPNLDDVAARAAFWGRAPQLEVRSSMSEITRCFFRRKFKLANRLPDTARYMVPLYKRPAPRSLWARKMEHWFADWADRSQFCRVSELGYDWLDFFYWEARVGTWQSLVLQDVDWYASPTVIFNNRKLLAALLSTPEQERIDDGVQRAVIERLEPAALEVPFVKNFGWKARLREWGEGAYFRGYVTLSAPIGQGRMS